jgi:hypothetical protein
MTPRPATALRDPAGRTPAGFYPINELLAHVVVAGGSAYCVACETWGRAPLPRETDYTPVLEAFSGKHKWCCR